MEIIIPLETHVHPEPRSRRRATRLPVAADIFEDDSWSLAVFEYIDASPKLIIFTLGETMDTNAKRVKQGFYDWLMQHGRSEAIAKELTRGPKDKENKTPLSLTMALKKSITPASNLGSIYMVHGLADNVSIGALATEAQKRYATYDQYLLTLKQKYPQLQCHALIRNKNDDPRLLSNFIFDEITCIQVQQASLRSYRILSRL